MIIFLLISRVLSQCEYQLTNGTCPGSCIESPNTSSNVCYTPVSSSSLCYLIIDVFECKANIADCYWFPNHGDWDEIIVDELNDEFFTDLNLQETQSYSCFAKGVEDLCTQYYKTKPTCLRGNYIPCYYDDEICKYLGTQPAVSCSEKTINAKACSMIKKDSCNWTAPTNTQSDKWCQLLSSNPTTCSSAANKFACDQVISLNEQCIWVPDTVFDGGTCVKYRPASCEGNGSVHLSPIKNVCMGLDFKCKWESKCSVVDTDKDDCSTPMMNRFACIEAAGQQCLWTGGKCSWFVEDPSAERCPADVNKFACRSLTAACAWQDGCTDFNIRVHRCDDGLSKLACQLVPYPCIWNISNTTCKSLQSPTECQPDLNQLNQVACLSLNHQCQWDTGMGKCLHFNSFLELYQEQSHLEDIFTEEFVNIYNQLFDFHQLEEPLQILFSEEDTSLNTEIQFTPVTIEAGQIVACLIIIIY